MCLCHPMGYPFAWFALFVVAYGWESRAGFSCGRMTKDRNLLIELAIKPLMGQAEDYMVAQEEIRARMEEDGVRDDVVGEAIRSFERADRRGIVRHWKVALYILVALLVVAAVVQNLRMRAALVVLSGMANVGSDDPAPKIQRPVRFSADELLLIYGFDGGVGEAERWKPLWESEPGNSAYFAEYVGGVYQDTDTVPDELIEKAAEIDPDNGWYAAMKAGSLLKGNIEQGKQTGEEKKALKAVDFTVIDEEKFSQALVLLHEAARKPTYDSYQQEMMSKRLVVMGKPTDWFSYIAQLAYVAGDSSPGLMGTRYFSQALAVEAGRCAEKGDREGCLRAIATWEAMVGKLLDDGYTLVDLLVTKVVLTEPAAHFRDAALTLGLKDEAKRFADLVRWKHEERKSREERRKYGDVSDEVLLMDRKSSLMASLSLPVTRGMVRKPPAFTAEDVHPSRLMEYAFFLRMLIGAGGLALLLVMGAAALRLACSSKRNLLLSRRLCDMLPAREWILILFVGGVLPVLWYGFLFYLTPFSARDWSLRIMFPFPLQFLCAVILILALTSVLASWRCDRRLGLLCGKSKSPKWRWYMAVSAFLALPVCGAVLPLGFLVGLRSMPLHVVLWISAALSAVPLLWMVFRVIKPAFGKQDPTPRTACLIRMALPGVCFGILALLAAAPLLRWEERHWLAKDRLMEITPEAPAMSRYEWDVKQVLRAELSEVLGGR